MFYYYFGRGKKLDVETPQDHTLASENNTSPLCMILINGPEMVGSLSLAKSTSWDYADASFLQQFQAVEHVRGQR